MENECERLDILHRFCFPGWVDHSLIPAFLQRADMVVSMSETEGLSRVYLETQAAARLLIASDIAPAREVISDGVTGLLFRLGDVEDLADKILWAALHPHARKTIGTRARAQAERWPLREAVKAYLGAFTRCIEQYQPLAK
jgi:glycosyltransferase involved in cell wall biosynthesis